MPDTDEAEEKYARYKALKELSESVGWTLFYNGCLGETANNRLYHGVVRNRKKDDAEKLKALYAIDELEKVGKWLKEELETLDAWLKHYRKENPREEK